LETQAERAFRRGKFLTKNWGSRKKKKEGLPMGEKRSSRYAGDSQLGKNYLQKNNDGTFARGVSGSRKKVWRGKGKTRQPKRYTS